MAFLTHFSLNAPRECRMKAKKFRDSTRCICGLFERLFPRFQADFWRIWVNCIPESPNGNIEVSGGGVCSVDIHADTGAYFQATNQQKKQLALDWLWLGITRIIADRGLSATPFRRTYNTIVDNAYENVWIPRSYNKLNPSRNRRANVVLTHDVEFFRAELTIKDKVGTILFSEVLFEVGPSEYEFASKLGNLKWLSSCLVQFTDKTGSAIKKIELTDNRGT